MKAFRIAWCQLVGSLSPCKSLFGRCASIFPKLSNTIDEVLMTSTDKCMVLRVL